MKIEYHFLEETDSTNRWLRQRGGGEAQAVVCWTDYQSAGRGCGNNSWESERGKNLLFSLLVRPAFLAAKDQFVLSMMMANAVREALTSLLPVREVSVKWPNDIYVSDQKICGILIESQLRGSLIAETVLGVGLNVNQARFLSDAPNPVSLLQLLGHEVDRRALLGTIVEAFCAGLERLEGEPGYAKDVHQNYLEHVYRREGLHAYCDEHGRFEARLSTVEPDGHLVLCDSDGGVRRYAFKEVSYIV